MTPLGRDDAEAVAAMVEAHEGEESADLARFWLAARPDAWCVVRDAGGAPAGAMLRLPLHDVTADDADADPAVAAALAELGRRPPLRAGEQATHLRFWLAADTYQGVGPVQNLVAGRLALHYLTTGGLAITFMPFADPDFWAVFCTYTDFHRMPAADYTVGGRRYAVFGHDWRRPARRVGRAPRRPRDDRPARGPAGAAGRRRPARPQPRGVRGRRPPRPA